MLARPRGPAHAPGRRALWCRSPRSTTVPACAMSPPRCATVSRPPVPSGPGSAPAAVSPTTSGCTVRRPGHDRAGPGRCPRERARRRPPPWPAGRRRERAVRRRRVLRRRLGVGPVGRPATLMLADGLGHGPRRPVRRRRPWRPLHRAPTSRPPRPLRAPRHGVARHPGRGRRRRPGRDRCRAVAVRGRRQHRGAVARRARGGVPLLSRPGIVGVHRPRHCRSTRRPGRPTGCCPAQRRSAQPLDAAPTRTASPRPRRDRRRDVRDASSSARPVRDDTAVAVLAPTRRTGSMTRICSHHRHRRGPGPYRHRAPGRRVRRVRPDRTRLDHGAHPSCGSASPRAVRGGSRLDTTAAPAEVGLLACASVNPWHGTGAAARSRWRTTVRCDRAADAPGRHACGRTIRRSLAEALLGPTRTPRWCWSGSRTGGAGHLPP